MANITFHTTNPRDLINVYDYKNYEIDEVTIYSIDNKTLLLKKDSIFKKNIVTSYDVALASIKLKNNNKNYDYPLSKKFIDINIMIENLILFLGKNEFVFLINGKYNVIPETKLIESFQSSESNDNSNSALDEIENELSLNSGVNISIIRAYNKLSDYFSAEKFSFNSNVFKLLEHQDEAFKLAKKVLLQNLAVKQVSK